MDSLIIVNPILHASLAFTMNRVTALNLGPIMSLALVMGSGTY